jgi:hypothetical protein
MVQTPKPIIVLSAAAPPRLQCLLELSLKLFWGGRVISRMKASLTLIGSCILMSAVMVHAQSKRTAEFILSNPGEYQGKEVTLDVAMVQPVKWVSPLTDYAFFHAMTFDRRDDKFGGGILVAVPSGESASFAKKYGTNFEGRNNSRTMRGTLVAAGGGKHRGAGIWTIDTTGNLLADIEAKKAEMPGEAFANGGAGPGRPGGPGPRRPMR